MKIKLQHLSKKEIINYHDGLKLGHFSEVELLIDHNTGKIKAFKMPERRLSLNKKSVTEIPWESVKKIGIDLIIVDVET